MDTQTAETPLNPAPVGNEHTRITSQNAREMAQKSIEARRIKAEQAAAPKPQDTAKDPYAVEQRDILRARINRLSELLETEKDPAKLDRLASAWAKLADLERILDGRPLPGSHRPTKGKASAFSLPDPV